MCVCVYFFFPSTFFFRLIWLRSCDRERVRARTLTQLLAMLSALFNLQAISGSHGKDNRQWNDDDDNENIEKKSTHETLRREKKSNHDSFLPAFFSTFFTCFAHSRAHSPNFIFLLLLLYASVSFPSSTEWEVTTQQKIKIIIHSH